MPAPYSLGENAKIYYSATPTATMSYVLPSTVADAVNDVKVAGDHDTPEYTTRANNGVKQYAVSLSDLGVTFKIKVPAAGVTNDAAYNAFRDAWKNKTEIAVYALTGDKAVAGSEGPAGNFVVAKWPIDQGNGTVQFADVELKPSSFNSWIVVSA